MQQTVYDTTTTTDNLQAHKNEKNMFLISFSRTAPRQAKDIRKKSKTKLQFSNFYRFR